jgi:antitoxin FitA
MEVPVPVPAPSPTAAAPSPRGAVTIRGLAPELKARLRVRAAHNARSMEAEARAILEAALLAAPEEDATDLAAFARALFAPLGGVELELPPRGPARDPPDLGAGAAGADPSPAGASGAVAAEGRARAGAAPRAPARRRR